MSVQTVEVCVHVEMQLQLIYDLNTANTRFTILTIVLRKFVYQNGSAEIINTNDCASDVCKIPIKTLIGQDIIKKLGSTFDKITELRDDLASNVDILKLLCEHSIVIDLLLKYYNINNVNDIVRVLRENNINISKYNELRTIIQTNVAKLNSRNFTMQDFKRLLAVDNI
jgi:hypothetical protein